MTPTLPNEVVIPKLNVPPIIVEHMNSKVISIAAYNSMHNDTIGIDISQLKAPQIVEAKPNDNSPQISS